MFSSFSFGDFHPTSALEQTKCTTLRPGNRSHLEDVVSQLTDVKSKPDVLVAALDGHSVAWAINTTFVL